MRRLLVISVLLLVGCASGAAPTEEPEPTLAPNHERITRAEYGQVWPFTVSAGTLSCYDGASAGGGGRVLVTFDAGDGIEYALNGSARDFGFPDLDTSIMPAWPETRPGVLVDLIERGLALCSN